MSIKQNHESKINTFIKPIYIRELILECALNFWRLVRNYDSRSHAANNPRGSLTMHHIANVAFSKWITDTSRAASLLQLLPASDSDIFLHDINANGCLFCGICFNYLLIGALMVVCLINIILLYTRNNCIFQFSTSTKKFVAILFFIELMTGLRKFRLKKRTFIFL